VKNKFRFDLAIQRNNVWTYAQKSMLMHSIMENYPIPSVFYLKSNDGFFWMIDGKQRFSGAIFPFLNDEYALDINTPSVMVEFEVKVDGFEEPKTVLKEEVVAGKKFSGLPKELQEEILNYTMAVVEISNATSEQIEEMFQRLNAGSSLTQMELTRALAGEETMAFSNEMTSRKFFSEFASFSPLQRTRYVDHELVLQILMLMLGRTTDISSTEIKAFAQDLRQHGLQDDWKEEFRTTIDYLTEAFEQQFDEDEKKNKSIRNKMLKKTHIPILFLMAQKASKHEISPEEFGKWAVNFLITNYKSGSEYTTAASRGAAKWNAVRTRITEMDKSLVKYFEIVEEPVVDASAEVAAGVEQE
jgi:hypothetical protein